ncbi:MAG: S8 family serine peptidase, partial [Actinomycetota bacterium]|nr:S8 family serine peptidase [Actinomycetota bacterium]
MRAVTASDAAVVALSSDPNVSSIELDRSRAVEATPDDPGYGDQWSLAKIGWDQAYGTVHPSGSAVVAVLDTGVDAGNADLFGNIVSGASFVAGSTWSSDPNGHGTEMAGIVAAETNNGTGIAGVGYAGVRVMPVTVLGADGLGSDSDIIQGVVWAADHGADVILMSFSAAGYSSALQAAVDYAWSKGVVLVAATGNDSSSASTFPAGDTGVIGVSNTDRSDALASSSNYGESVFLAAPGVGILTTIPGGGTTTITGTSASAAEVAGAAALLRAVDPSASAGTIVGRLARNADAAGSVAEVGNGRLNLARALSDVATDGLKPAGAAPVGDGGPFVGPYVAAAKLNGDLQGQSSPACSSPLPCPWQSNQLTGWAELQTAPLRLFFAAGQAGSTSNTFTISIDHAAGSTAGLESLTNFATSSNVSIAGGIPGGITFSTASGGDTWEYTFTASISDNNAGFVSFNTKLRAGAHNFSGASLQVKGAGTLQFIKPAAAPGAPDLSLTKTAITAVSPGQVISYTLSYRNLASGSNSATGVQLTDTLPSNISYVGGCSSSCTYDSVSGTLTWNLGTIPAGSALATQTFQVTVSATAANNTAITNTAQILSAENDTNTANNTASTTTTVFVPSISGTVLTDPNGNGNDDGDGSGLAGATVTLFRDGNANGTFQGAPTDPQVGLAVITPATGEWAFTSGLTKNTTYFVVRTNPSGYSSTNAIAEAVISDNSSATRDSSDDRIKVILLNQNNTFSANNKFLARVANSAPTATAQSVTTNEDTAKDITLGGSDVDGNTLTFSIVNGPTHGTLSSIGTVGCTGTAPKNCLADVTYTPSANYNGADSFT